MTDTMTETSKLTERVRASLQACGVAAEAYGDDHDAVSPLTGERLATLRRTTPEGIDSAIAAAHEAFKTWRDVPAPVRGNVVKRWGELLTEHKQDLADIVQAEAGKITSEAWERFKR